MPNNVNQRALAQMRQYLPPWRQTRRLRVVPPLFDFGRQFRAQTAAGRCTREFAEVFFHAHSTVGRGGVGFVQHGE